MVKILIVEDDPAIRLLTKINLKDRFEIYEAEDGEKALDILEHVKADLMIVDIMMPNMDGYEFVAELREAGDMTPVIMLTAMTSFNHKRKGFESGIDDYMTKPVDYEELSWHIDALLRRSKISAEKKLEVGSLVMYEDSKTVKLDGKNIELSQTEFELLYKLLSYPDVLFTKQQIMDEVWGYDTESDYSTIKTFISRIRNKLSECKDFEIVSLRGLGYKAVIK